MREVTFGDFAKLANKRGLTPEYLAERFTDKIERPSEFFHRFFQGINRGFKAGQSRPRIDPSTMRIEWRKRGIESRNK